MNLVRTYELDAGTDRVAGIVRSAEFNVEAEKARRETVIDTRWVAGSTPEQFELRSREHERTMRGAIDRARVARTVTRLTWEPAQRCLSWDYDGIASRLMTVSGRTRLADAGAGRTRVVHEVDVRVHLPLFGPLIARAVKAQFEAGFDAERRILERHLAQQDLREVA